MEHRNIPDEERHEPKGASSALSGTFYISDGNGSGNWLKLTDSNVEGLSPNTASGRLITAGGGGSFSSRSAVFDSDEITYDSGTLTSTLDFLLSEVIRLQGEIDALEQRVEDLENA